MRYVNTLKRIREGKTNYKKRKALLISKHKFVAIRVSNENLQIQIISAKKEGDQTLVSAHSKSLLKYGWKGSRNSLPACYLLGLLVGLKASSKGITKCIPYLRNFSPKVAAAIKGMIDGGLNVPIDDDVIPSNDRIIGKHIANYAASLDKDVYKIRFSRLLASGLKPEEYPEHFNKVKNIIMEGVGV